jgi:2-methylfumaryl-CoA hydratase
VAPNLLYFIEAAELTITEVLEMTGFVTTLLGSAML